MFPYFIFLQTVGTRPIAHIDQFTADMMASAELAEEVSLNGSGKLVKVSSLFYFFLSSFIEGVSRLLVLCMLYIQVVEYQTYLQTLQERVFW